MVTTDTIDSPPIERLPVGLSIDLCIIQILVKFLGFGLYTLRTHQAIVIVFSGQFVDMDLKLLSRKNFEFVSKKIYT